MSFDNPTTFVSDPLYSTYTEPHSDFNVHKVRRHDETIVSLPDGVETVAYEDGEISE